VRGVVAASANNRTLRRRDVDETQPTAQPLVAGDGAPFMRD